MSAQDVAALKRGIASVISQAVGMPLGDVRASDSETESVMLESGAVMHPWLPSNWPTESTVDGKSTLVTAKLYIQDSTAFIAKSALESRTFQDNFAGEMVAHCDPSAVSGHIYFDRISVIPDHGAIQHTKPAAEQIVHHAEPHWTTGASDSSSEQAASAPTLPSRGSAGDLNAHLHGGAEEDLNAHLHDSKVEVNAGGIGWFLVLTGLIFILGLGGYQYYKKLQDDKALLEWMRVSPEEGLGREFKGIMVPAFLSSMLQPKPAGYTGH